LRIDCRRAGICRLASILLAAAAIFAASCYSSDYKKEIAANTDLISGLSNKLADYCRVQFKINGREVSSEEMGEFYYALKKARAFSDMTKGETRQSHRDFDKLLEQYAQFVRAADQYRLSPAPDAEKTATLLKQHEDIEKSADRVRQDVQSES